MPFLTARLQYSSAAVYGKYTSLSYTNRSVTPEGGVLASSVVCSSGTVPQLPYSGRHVSACASQPYRMGQRHCDAGTLAHQQLWRERKEACW